MSPLTLSDPRLPLGSTILVTGVTGYIGSWVANEALSIGYKVRGVTRSLERSQWLQEYFNTKYGANQFQRIVLSDLLDYPKVEEAVKGVAGIINIAVDNALTPEPEPYISNVVAANLNVLKAAAGESSIKSVVLTSSSLAAAAWTVDKKLDIPADSYNESFISLARDPSFTDPGKVFVVYGAAKAEAERAAWDWFKDSKPAFTLNQVLPAANFGPALSFEKQGYPSTGEWPKMLFDGDLSLISGVGPQYFVNVRDVARVHVAALIDPSVNAERLFAYAEPYNWNDVLGLFRKAFPEREFVKDFEGLGRDLTVAPSGSAEKSLKVFGQDGWTGLEESVLETVKPAAK